MQMPGRTYTTSIAYRFGFNGNEKSDEINGSAVDYDYGARIYDARAGKFFSVDPLFKSYSWNSPYAYAENRPVDGIDLDGKEWQNFISKFKDPGHLKVKVPNEETAQIQQYSTLIQNAKLSFSDLKSKFMSSPQEILSNSRATFNSPVDAEGKPTQFKTGSYIKIDITGPFNNGYIKVLDIQDKGNSASATFITMEGHIENGIIKFSLLDLGNGKYSFSVVSISDVDQAGAKIFSQTARSEQRKSWEEVLDNIIKKSGGKEVKRLEKITDKKKNDEKKEKKP